MKFKIVSLGCKVNSYECEALINDLTLKGWELTKKDECDVVIINTCTVTQTSDSKSRQMIRSLKRKNPNAIVVAMGCYVQLNPEEAGSIADIVIGTNGRAKIYDLVNSYINTRKEINEVTNIMEVNDYEELKVNAVMTHTRGFVKIQDGCENYCSYCAIPYSRGKIRSRLPENVIEEINRLVNSGTNEVIISGINTGTYGKDLGTINLAQLIEKIMEETKLYRLRLSSIEMMEVTDELLDVIEKYKDRFANHLHIPLQGGCDSVLTRMNRKYLTDGYRKLIYNIRKRFEDIAITTDLLAGFVGETEEEFKDTCSFIKEMQFSDMHIFPYSRRKGTKADEMKGHLNPQVINERAHILLNIKNEMKEKYEAKFIGQTFDVITEQVKGDYFTSHSSNYLEILIPKHGLKDNMIKKIKIVEINNGNIIGQGVENE